MLSPQEKDKKENHINQLAFMAFLLLDIENSLSLLQSLSCCVFFFSLAKYLFHLSSAIFALVVIKVNPSKYNRDKYTKTTVKQEPNIEEASCSSALTNRPQNLSLQIWCGFPITHFIVFKHKHRE